MYRNVLGVVSACMRSLAIIVLLGLATYTTAQQSASAPEWKPVEDAMGRPGQVTGEVIRFAMPRKDLRVTVANVAIKPGLALGSWAAFKRSGKDAIVMGDLVLTEEEVSPVMRKLQEGGVQVSALHNHLLGESPHVMYMHIAGYGEAMKMATAIRNALALTKTPPPDTSSASELGVDQKKIEDALGRSGKVNGGILQFSVPRAETITEHAEVIPPSMGVATAINFQPTANGQAAITGDLVLLGSEVDPVMKALRENGIEVTALHSHMLMEEPRLFFMHFWASNDAAKLAKGLRVALDLTNYKK